LKGLGERGVITKEFQKIAEARHLFFYIKKQAVCRSFSKLLVFIKLCSGNIFPIRSINNENVPFVNKERNLYNMAGF